MGLRYVKKDDQWEPVLPDCMALYVAGPMRGKPHFNFPAFDEATDALRELGHTVYSPAEHDRETGLDETKYPTGELAENDAFSVADALRWDIKAISEVDAIVVLSGWESSTGVRVELTYGVIGLGLPVYLWPHMDKPLAEGYVRSVLDITLRAPTASAALTTLMTPGLPQSEYDAAHKVFVSGEVRVVDPTTGASKGSKLARFDLLPWDVIYELAEHYGKGCAKYAARNWEGGYDWSLSLAAAARHFSQFMAGEDFDDETGSSHLIAAAWHCFGVRWFQLHNKGTDDRSKP